MKLTVIEAARLYRAGKPVKVHAVGFYNTDDNGTITRETSAVISKGDPYTETNYITGKKELFIPETFKEHLLYICNVLAFKCMDANKIYYKYSTAD